MFRIYTLTFSADFCQILCKFMNPQIKDTLEKFKIPELIIHSSCESIFDAHWNFEKDLTFEELLDCECGGADDESKGTLRELFEDTKTNGFWAFSSTKEHKIHLWFQSKPDTETLMMVLGHELGHLFVDKLDFEKNTDEAQEYFRDENNADLFGIISVFALLLSEKFNAIVTT